jgi:hypothetical protein
MPTNAAAERDPSLLGIYLNDHLAGATAGLELFRRTAGAHTSTDAAPVLTRLVQEIEEDREALLGIMKTLEIPVAQYKVAGAWVAEKIGRAKPNGRLTSRSPLSSVIELEGMRLGVLGKGSGWKLLRELAASEPRLDASALDRLIERAERQAEEIEQLRIAAGKEALSPA